MRRILYAFSQLVILAAALAAIYFLGGKAIKGINDLGARVNRNRAQAAQVVIFPGTATKIAAINTQISDQKTHAPSATLTPTDEFGNPDTGDTSGMQPQDTNPALASSDVPPPSPTALPTDTALPTATDTVAPSATATNTTAPS